MDVSANEASKFGGEVERNAEGIVFSALFAAYQSSFWKLSRALLAS